MEKGSHVPSEWALEIREVLLSATSISARIKEVGAQLSKDFDDKNPVLVVVLKGSFMFASDLSRAMSIPHELEFIRASSYVGAESSGNVSIQGLESVEMKGRHVIIIEDIVDTGLTLKELFKAFQGMGVKTVKCCSFLEKETGRRQKDVPTIDYVAFKIPDEFVVGYGLDFDQRFRHLPFVGVYKQ